MKRYEKMTAKDIMDAFNAPYNVWEAPNGLAEADCVGCLIWKNKNTHCSREWDCSSHHCTELIRQFLNEEIETKPRWQLAKSNDDITIMIGDWARKQKCKPSDELLWSLDKYLCEEIEIQD